MAWKLDPDLTYGENREAMVTAWANWAVVGNDAVYPHQIPFVLKELHDRIKTAIRGAIKDSRELP